MNLIRETFTDKKQESKKLNIAAVGEEDAQKRQRVKKKKTRTCKRKTYRKTKKRHQKNNQQKG